MKFSRFNLFTVDDKGTMILLNTLTSALATFDPKYSSVVFDALDRQDVSKIPIQFLKDMKENGYVVEHGMDELTSIESMVKERQSRVDEYSFSISLNGICNFKCGYCFQRHDGKILSNKQSDVFVAMIRKVMLTARKVEVDWFGGEPLLSFGMLQKMNDQLIDMSKIAKIDYSYSITTNGYLLNKNVIEYLRVYPPSSLIITLDGPPDIHNKTRPLKNGGETFLRILNNIERAVRFGLKISVRINISRLNLHCIPELFVILEKRGLKNIVDINLQPVVSSTVNPYEEHCLSGYELAHAVMLICKEMAEKGWVLLPAVEKMKILGFCVGEYPNRNIVDIKGNIYRCGQMFDESAVGRVSDTGIIIPNEKNVSEWENKNPLNFPECRDCSFLPICMGGCNLKRLKGDGTDYCLDWKYDVSTFLKAVLLNENNVSFSEGGDAK